MTCPTCGHSLHGIGHGMAYCPRCGTLALGTDVAEPALVRRVWTFGELVRLSPDQAGEWHRLGLSESVGTTKKPEATGS